MRLIQHRVNTLAQLREVSGDHGIEIDVRGTASTLWASHDPLPDGEPLKNLVATTQHNPVVFNMKCDGLESHVLKLAEQQHLQDYFLLDIANPTLVELTRRGVRHIAVRYSEYEPLEFALAFAGKVDWVWVDCFTRLPLDPTSYQRLRQHFKICLVSPELQQHPRSMIQVFRAQLERMPIDAVCTDYPGDWR